MTVSYAAIPRAEGIVNTRSMPQCYNELNGSNDHPSFFHSSSMAA